MSRRPPGKKTVFLYLLIGLVLLAVFSILLGGATWFRLVRTLVIYGAAFLLLMYLFGRLRRR